MLTTVAVAVPLARAAQVTPGAPAIQSASLQQAGRDLVWTVEMRAPFSPSALGAAGRSLCLVVERVRGDRAPGQLCVAGPRRGSRTPSLRYTPIGAARGTAVAATVTRAGSGPPHCSSPRGTACDTAWPAQSAIASLHVPQPVGCTDTGPPFVTDVTTERREIALTFDDGPWYQTPEFLSLLERYKVPATFFEIGEHIAQYGEGGAIERRMLADGDMIGDHTWSHADVEAGGSFAAEQIDKAAEAIRRATHGFTPCLFRAPEGNVGPLVIAEARSLGFTTIQWDIDPRDWALPGVGEIEDNVLANAHPGAIVVMHDGGGDRSETLQALPDIIDTLRARGYTFVTVTRLLGQRAIYR